MIAATGGIGAICIIGYVFTFGGTPPGRFSQLTHQQPWHILPALRQVQLSLRHRPFPHRHIITIAEKSAYFASINRRSSSSHPTAIQPLKLGSSTRLYH